MDASSQLSSLNDHWISHNSAWSDSKLHEVILKFRISREHKSLYQAYQII